jgi:hypothetical protein
LHVNISDNAVEHAMQAYAEQDAFAEVPTGLDVQQQ